MPLYEYRCDRCGRRFEILQRVGEGAKGASCPNCGSPKVEKEFSTFASAGSESCAGRGRFT